MNAPHWNQFKAIAECYYVIPVDFWTRPAWHRLDVAVHAWHTDFYSDITQSRAGYPRKAVKPTPVLEDALHRLLNQAGISPEWRKPTVPTLCLTHDIDYLVPTLPMRLKRVISKREWPFFKSTEPYLDSIDTLLSLDADAGGGLGVSTLFIPAPFQSTHPKTRLMQWMIDPGYRLDSPLFQQLKRLIARYDATVGIHGSYFSLTEKRLSQEIKQLAQTFNRAIIHSRQHWLHLPDSHASASIHAAGIQLDSTLGWNGAVGFRCGLARPFPLIIPHAAQPLWEVPLLLMDGPLFDDMALSTNEAVTQSIELLTEVYERQGCVAINWHDRAAHPDYGWSEAYARILDWAKARGFRFTSFNTLQRELITMPRQVTVCPR